MRARILACGAPSARTMASRQWARDLLGLGPSLEGRYLIVHDGRSIMADATQVLCVKAVASSPCVEMPSSMLAPAAAAAAASIAAPCLVDSSSSLTSTACCPAHTGHVTCNASSASR
jgi:hypothetical protein